jgi:uncharacterized repeat protein (TIGR01451 family)
MMNDNRQGGHPLAAKHIGVMRTLAEVFAPGAPTLPEGLRTLAVSPERELEPGMTVRATFTFRNQGGATATGVRVRFNVPDGLVYLVGSGQLDSTGLDDDQGNSPLLARNGAHIGDVQPGEERRIDISYSVAGAIENGSTIELQAAVASFELPPVGSNVVRLVARSRPQLQNALTNVGIETRRDAAPGSEMQVLVRVHNAGESSAHDLVVVAPIPPDTTYVANSVRVNGREIERELGTSFDRVYAPIVVPLLGASGTATLLYRVRVADPLPDGTAIVAHAQVASQETPAFELEPASLTVTSTPEFADDRTSFTVDPALDVVPGARVTLRLQVLNSGTAAAESVTATFDLPDALIPVRGASRIDGRAVRERKKDAAFDLGRIDKHESVELTCEATVATPLPHGELLPVAVTLSWDPHGTGDMRHFERTIVVRSAPYVAARRSAVVRGAAELVHPGEEVEATVTVANDGSAAATGASLHLRVDPSLEEVRAFEKNARVHLNDDAVELGTIEPYAHRRLVVRARVRAPLPNRTELHLGASLHCAELGETTLGEATWRVDSHPAFAATSTRIELSGDAVLRPNQLAEAFVSVRNEGSDTAHNVRVRLYVSPEARLESVEGATRERSTVAFGEIAPGARAQARLGLRLLRGMAKTYPVTVDAVLTADAMLPLPLERLIIATTAEPDFSVGGFRSDVSESIDVGEMIEWTLNVRNGGDGPARRVHITVAQPESLIYVPNSTTVNDVPVRDIGAQSTLTSERGISFNDVDPGVEATIRWRDVVHNGLPAGDAIERVAQIRYDGDRTDEIVSSELHVRAEPAFANTIPGLPFGVDGMLGPAFAGGRRELGAEHYVQLPPATPVGGDEPRVEMIEDDAPQYLALDASNGRTRNVGTLIALGDERLARTRRFLAEARFDGLVTHLFGLRAFFPDAVGDQHASAIAPQRDALRDLLDRLFIKLRLPNYAIAARDIETPSSRATLERFLNEAAALRGTPAEPPASAAVLRGEADMEALQDIADRLAEAPLASAQPWAALARFVPNGSNEGAAYRAGLVAALDALVEAEPAEFLDVLQHQPYPHLDAALGAFVRRC